MALQPTFADQERLASTRRQERPWVQRRELAAELWATGLLIAIIGAVWVVAPPHGLGFAAAFWCMGVMILATRVRFDTPFGFTVATQLAFVPLLFAVPLALVPLAVVVALLIARVPDVLRREIAASQLLRTPSNAWFTLGPVLVFTLAGETPQRAGGLLLLAALAGQFAVDFAASALRCRLARSDSIRDQLRDTWVYVIDAALSGVGLVVAEELTRRPYAVLAMVPLLGLMAMFAHERQGRLTSLIELNDTYRGTALLLGDVIAADDGYTGEHSQGVVQLALAAGEVLGLDADRRRNLEFGALLHDVGKIAIPKEIINKPGKLDAAEWELIKTHTVEGERMLNRVGGFMRDVGRIVRSHHERWDGGGYPDRLAGDAIPLESRIITCCDSWNAMRTDRPYRAAMSHEIASAELRVNSGTQFDPAVVAALIQIVAREAAVAPPATPAVTAPVTRAVSVS